LGFEAGIRIDGIDWATVARRSSGGWKLEVTGMQAHSSQIFSPEVGAGAIFEAARILNEFYNEVRGDRHLSFNAGSFLGGTDVEYDFEQMSGTVFGKSNVVPNKVVIQGQIRTISAQQLETTQSAMRHIVAQHLPGTDAKITFADGFPPMSPTDGNKKLQRSLSTINEALGGDPMPALDPSKRGAADISFAAPHADSLAGLGPVGADWHSPNEHIDLTTLPLAVKRAALLIYRLTRE
jgi:glutamate carboxypeptidase